MGSSRHCAFGAGWSCAPSGRQASSLTAAGAGPLASIGSYARAHPRDLVAAGACAAPLVIALILAFRSGGFFITSWGLAAIVLVGLLAAVALILRDGWGGLAGGIALAGWLALAAWQGLSQIWSPDASAATTVMDLTILYGSAFALVLLGVRRTSWLVPLMDGALLVTVIVAAYGVCARLLPDLIGDDPDPRLSTPISYWNAFGALTAFGVVLAIGLAGAAHRHPAIRGLAAAAVPLLALGLVFTLSRGSFVTLLVGLVLLVVLARGRLETLAVGIVTLALSAVAAAFAQSRDLLTLSEPLGPHGEAGAQTLGVLVACMIVAGVLAPLAVLPLRRLAPRGRGVAGAAVGVPVAIAALVVAFAIPAGGPFAWGDRQFESFRSYGGGTSEAGISERLVDAAGSGRWQQWTVAAEDFRADPISGSGAGSYAFVWNLERPIDQTVQNAHSLYLEILAENGVIGLLLLLTPLVAGAVIIGLALARRPAGISRELGVAVAVSAVIVVHMAGDWDWQLPAVVLPALVIGAGALKASSLVVGGPSLPRVGSWSGWATLAVALGAMLFLIGPTSSAHVVNDARAAAADGDPERALELARRAGDLDPQSPDPPALEGLVLSDLGRPAASDQAFARAHARSPEDWVILADWSAAVLARGDVEAAALLAEEAAALNPMEERVALLLDLTAE